MRGVNGRNATKSIGKRTGTRTRKYATKTQQNRNSKGKKPAKFRTNLGLIALKKPRHQTVSQTYRKNKKISTSFRPIWATLLKFITLRRARNARTTLQITERQRYLKRNRRTLREVKRIEGKVSEKEVFRRQFDRKPSDALLQIENK